MKVILIFCVVVLVTLVVLLVVPMRVDEDLQGRQARPSAHQKLSEAFIAYKNKYAAYSERRL